MYYAFLKLGRVVRTWFLLEYVNSEELQRIIQGATNRCKSFNKFAQRVYFASDLIQENVREEQLKVIKYNHLIANLLIFHNCKSLTQALNELQDARYGIDARNSAGAESVPAAPESIRHV